MRNCQREKEKCKKTVSVFSLPDKGITIYNDGRYRCLPVIGGSCDETEKMQKHIKRACFSSNRDIFYIVYTNFECGSQRNYFCSDVSYRF